MSASNAPAARRTRPAWARPHGCAPPPPQYRLRPLRRGRRADHAAARRPRSACGPDHLLERGPETFGAYQSELRRWFDDGPDLRDRSRRWTMREQLLTKRPGRGGGGPGGGGGSVRAARRRMKLIAGSECRYCGGAQASCSCMPRDGETDMRRVRPGAIAGPER